MGALGFNGLLVPKSQIESSQEVNLTVEKGVRQFENCVFYVYLEKNKKSEDSATVKEGVQWAYSQFGSKDAIKKEIDYMLEMWGYPESMRDQVSQAFLKKYGF